MLDHGGARRSIGGVLKLWEDDEIHVTLESLYGHGCQSCDSVDILRETKQIGLRPAQDGRQPQRRL